MPDDDLKRTRGTKPRTDLPRTESDLQPDPLLRPRRSGAIWPWIIGVAVAVILAFVFYGLNLNGRAGNAPLPGNASTQTPNTIGQAPPPATSPTTGQAAPAQGAR